MKLRLFLLLAALLGCLPPAAGPVVGDCLGRIREDATRGMNLAQIVADCGVPCGVDVAEIVAVLLESRRTDPVVHSPAYAEAHRWRLQQMEESE